MNDILEKKANIWCERFNKLMKEKDYTQASFLKEYRKKYGGGTQANVSRWLHVGNATNTPNKKIGFPSYETMVNIADFFGVSVGYLTGETDYDDFNIEKSCQYFDIDQETVKAMYGIVTGKRIPFGEIDVKQYKAVFKYFMTSEKFLKFVINFKKYGEILYREKNSKDYFDELEKEMGKELFDLAYNCKDYTCIKDEDGRIYDDFKDNNIEQTPELLKAMSKINDAIDKICTENAHIEIQKDMYEYNLLKLYFEFMKEVSSDDKFINSLEFDGI